MADAGFQLVLNGLARVIGGSVSSQDGHFFSGALVNDASGIAGVKGCWSVKPRNLQATPVAVLIPDSFTAEYPLQGEQEAVDWVTCVLYVARQEEASAAALLNSFRDTFPAAFHQHMLAFGTVNLAAYIARGKTVVREFGQATYLAWDFAIHIDRSTSYALTA